MIMLSLRMLARGPSGDVFGVPQVTNRLSKIATFFPGIERSPFSEFVGARLGGRPLAAAYAPIPPFQRSFLFSLPRLRGPLWRRASNAFFFPAQTPTRPYFADRGRNATRLKPLFSSVGVVFFPSSCPDPYTSTDTEQMLTVLCFVYCVWVMLLVLRAWLWGAGVREKLSSNRRVQLLVVCSFATMVLLIPAIIVEYLQPRVRGGRHGTPSVFAPGRVVQLYMHSVVQG